MTALLRAGDLTSESFQELVGRLDIPADDAPRLWLEAADGWTLDAWPGLDGQVLWYAAHCDPQREPVAACLKRSEAGRLFAPSGELRWRVVPALDQRAWRTVFLGTRPWDENRLADRSYLLGNLTPRNENYFLWGQQSDNTPGEWIELRIPHRFRYPVDPPSQHVQVVVELWSDQLGDTHFVRLCQLIPFQETV